MATTPASIPLDVQILRELDSIYDESQMKLHVVHEDLRARVDRRPERVQSEDVALVREARRDVQRCRMTLEGLARL